MSAQLKSPKNLATRLHLSRPILTVTGAVSCGIIVTERLPHGL